VKRCEALRSLSREHHRALTVGRDLRRAEDPELAAATFLEFWEREGAEHFRIEEEVLLPTWNLLGTVHAEAAARLAREHLQVRSAALALAEAPSLAAVRQLGEELVAHVRFEERELFPMIEADLGATELEQLARAVAEAERER
jgi:hemerythrin-like domain-containing protein